LKYPREDSNRSSEHADVPTGYAIEDTTPGTKSGTVDAHRAALQALIEVWDTLDTATVNRIMKLIQR